MEFRREHEMLGAVSRWLECRGLLVKSEFANPWGICDLVGCALNRKRVQQRLALRQHLPIGPPLRIALLQQIPDESTGRSISVKRLCQRFVTDLPGETIRTEIAHLRQRNFVSETSHENLHRKNGWMPLHDSLVAVELKLERTHEAVRQAIANRQLTWESYIAMPRPAAQRVIRSQLADMIRREGIGVLSVTREQCRVLLAPAKHAKLHVNEIAVTHCIERFWRDSQAIEH